MSVIIMQVLYEAIFALSSVDSLFSVYTHVGHVLVDPDCAPLSKLVQVSSVFVVEENDSGPDLLNPYLPAYVEQLEHFLLLGHT